MVDRSVTAGDRRIQLPNLFLSPFPRDTLQRAWPQCSWVDGRKSRIPAWSSRLNTRGLGRAAAARTYGSSEGIPLSSGLKHLDVHNTQFSERLHGKLSSIFFI